MADYTNPVTAAARTIYAETVLAELAKLAMPLRGFSTDFSAETAKPGTTIDADFASASEVKTTFPGYTSFTDDGKSVKLELDKDFSAGFTVEESKLMSRGAAYVQEAARLNAAAVVNAFVAEATTAATGAKATQVLTLAKGAAFDAAALKAVYAKLISVGIDPAFATLALAGADYATLATSLPYNMIGRTDNAMATGVIGSALGLREIIVGPGLTDTDFVSAPSGLILAARAIPLTSEGVPGFRREVFKDPATGLTLTMTEAFDTSTGATTFSVRLIGGVNVADPKAIVKITRAAS